MDPEVGMLGLSGLLGACVGWGLAQFRAAPAPVVRVETTGKASTGSSGVEGLEREAEVQRLQSHLAKTQTRFEEMQAELRRMEGLLDARMATDRLTGLGDFRAARDRLMQEFWRSQRYHTSLSVLRVDIDGLSQYNAEFGEKAGDQYIKHVAEVLARCARNTDLVTAHGGGEFVVLLTETGSHDVMVVAGRILQEISAMPTGTWESSVSIGVSSMRLGVEDPQTLMDEARRALDAAKHAGRNCVVNIGDMRDGAPPSPLRMPVAGS